MRRQHNRDPGRSLSGSSVLPSGEASPAVHDCMGMLAHRLSAGRVVNEAAWITEVVKWTLPR
eukprot:15402924-Alexandrium_andersonii.AAC.1